MLFIMLLQINALEKAIVAELKASEISDLNRMLEILLRTPEHHL